MHLLDDILLLTFQAWSFFFQVRLALGLHDLVDLVLDPDLLEPEPDLLEPELELLLKNRRRV